MTGQEKAILGQSKPEAVPRRWCIFHDGSFAVAGESAYIHEFIQRHVLQTL